jgi:predicted ester cyclase
MRGSTGPHRSVEFAPIDDRMIPMTVDHEELVEQYVREAWEMGDVAKLDQYVITDHVRHRAPLADIAGREELKQSITDFHSAFSNIHFEVDEVVVQGNTIATRGVLRATHTGTSPAFKIPATGKEIEMPFAAMSHMQEDGRSKEEWVYQDLLGVMQQLGAIPAASD